MKYKVEIYGLSFELIETSLMIDKILSQTSQNKVEILTCTC